MIDDDVEDITCKEFSLVFNELKINKGPGKDVIETQQLKNGGKKFTKQYNISYTETGKGRGSPINGRLM